jgi:hypothetical protein
MHTPFEYDSCSRLFEQIRDVLRPSNSAIVYTFPFCGHEYRCQTLDKQIKISHIADLQIISPASFPGLDECVAHLTKLFETSQPIVIIHAETLFKKSAHYWLQKIIDAHEYSQASLLWMAEAMPFQLQALPVPILAKLTTHQFWLPQLTIEETNDFVAYLEQSIEVNNSFSCQDMFQETNGHLWLIKEIVRQQKNSTRSLKEIVNTPSYKAKAELLYQAFPQEFKDSIQSVIQSKTIAYPNVIEQAKTLGIIHADKVLPGYIKRCAATEQAHDFIVHAHKLLLNQVNVTEVFSQTEQAALKLFFAKKPNFVTRDEIAQAFWSETEYTDWALDRAMFRLKKKLSRLGLPDTFISNVRGVGYKFTH